MSDLIRQRRENRWKFLRSLYRSSEEDVAVYGDGYEIAEELQLPRQDAERIVRYLEDYGYVKNTVGSGLTLRITAEGIDHVERRLMEEDA
jgi:DNA-binding MarR family transcriptional regulator